MTTKTKTQSSKSQSNSQSKKETAMKKTAKKAESKKVDTMVELAGGKHRGSIAAFLAKVEGKKLHVECPENPKHGKSAKRFGHYKNGMTSKQAIEAGLWAADLEWDSRPTHSFYSSKGERLTKVAYISWK